MIWIVNRHLNISDCALYIGNVKCELWNVKLGNHEIWNFFKYVIDVEFFIFNFHCLVHLISNRSQSLCIKVSTMRNSRYLFYTITDIYNFSLDLFHNIYRFFNLTAEEVNRCLFKLCDDKIMSMHVLINRICDQRAY